MNERLYLLKIRLVNIKPTIWRRFVVPADITLDRLHDVIQVVMGWEDYHLHQFTIDGKRYTESPESREDGLECGRYRLGDLIKKKGSSFSYLYDFGDNWEHEVMIENNRYSDPELPFPIECLDGARACPPEDVGGFPGYHEFCKALKDPAHEAHKSLKEWWSGFYGDEGDFDSKRFDVEMVNNELLNYMRWARDRFRPWHEGKNSKPDF